MFLLTLKRQRQSHRRVRVCVCRLHHLERKVMEDVGKPSEVVCELKSEVESFKRKLEVYVSV